MIWMAERAGNAHSYNTRSGSSQAGETSKVTIRRRIRLVAKTPAATAPALEDDDVVNANDHESDGSSSGAAAARDTGDENDDSEDLDSSELRSEKESSSDSAKSVSLSSEPEVVTSEALTLPPEHDIDAASNSNDGATSGLTVSADRSDGATMNLMKGERPAVEFRSDPLTERKAKIGEDMSCPYAAVSPASIRIPDEGRILTRFVSLYQPAEPAMPHSITFQGCERSTRMGQRGISVSQWKLMPVSWKLQQSTRT